MELNAIKNRLGDIVEFDSSKIKNAILKAYEACNEKDTSDADLIVESVINQLRCNDSENIVTIEDIQDSVENCLMEAWSF